MLTRELYEKAKNGDAAAMATIADAFFNGEGGQDNIPKSLLLYKKAYSLDPNNSWVISQLGVCYEKGIGVDPNAETARKMYHRAALLGSPDGQYHLALCLQNDNNQESIRWFKEAADHGHIEAAYNIGMQYLASQESDLAERYLTIAANGQHIKALTELGMHLMLSMKDMDTVTRGIKLLEKANNLGGAKAASYLSSLYLRGIIYDQNLEMALQLATFAAQNGEPGAVFSIGNAYYEGKDVPEDKAKALYYYKLAADYGEIDCAENVGIMLRDGEAGEANKAEAILWFEKAALGGSESAIYRLEKLYPEVYGNPGYVKYANLLMQVSKVGFSHANVEIYKLLSSGKYLPKDIRLANSYLDKALSAQDGEACFIRANQLREGTDGFQVDKEEAFRLWMIPAKAGNSASANSVGLCYMWGDGVTQDPKEAIKWFTQSISGENENAYYNLARLLLGDDEPAFAPYVDYEQGIKYMKKAAELGVARACFKLSSYYITGSKGLPEDANQSYVYLKAGAEKGDPDCAYFYGKSILRSDPTTAFHMLEVSAEQGKLDAMEFLGLAYEQEGNEEKAIYYLQKAAARGSGKSAAILGNRYKDGKGVPKDELKALELFEMAAEQGNALAQFQAGRMYFLGDIVAKNRKKAFRYLTAASSSGLKIATVQLAELLSDSESTQEEQYQAGDMLCKLLSDIDPRSESNIVTLSIMQLQEIYPKKLNREEDLFPVYLNLANRGDCNAQYFVGRLYYLGIGTEKDIEKAINWWKLAADNGHEKAKTIISSL